MILVDTSIWIDHLRAGDSVLTRLLETGRVLAHPLVIGELALGHLHQRQQILDALHDLPKATVATDVEVLAFIDRQQLAGLGIGYVDVHLLASVQLTPDAQLWTRDKRLHAVASERQWAAKLGEIS
ncbi:MAG: type II toxin-antitoxin system VapC family toxin [Xanthomonadaceae bacterium]|nr:type II toxin-antitoxin system VapC family toxin [Xanthomonadaceae bacterium]MDP2185341.1 type II toxin-antitoxin system VapC family toxin [Xanthomonadales bacterium]MDZ4117190.1 type II toxin-antitoxin system VapC family toxin [Xanthomonadaceae bacterium]